MMIRHCDRCNVANDTVLQRALRTLGGNTQGIDLCTECDSAFTEWMDKSQAPVPIDVHIHEMLDSAAHWLSIPPTTQSDRDNVHALCTEITSFLRTHPAANAEEGGESGGK